MLLPGASNRDPRKFEDPNEFQLDRKNVREHVAFGRGAHSCPGAPLARAEGRISMNRILDRMANIRMSEKVHGAAGCAALRLRADVHHAGADRHARRVRPDLTGVLNLAPLCGGMPACLAVPADCREIDERGLMSEGVIRVVVWSTGGIGSIAVRAVAENPGTDLVGVWVHSPDKAGRDAGEIVGIGPIGVIATNDADALIALRPDCVVYAANGPERDAAAVPDYVRLLEAGINVVTTTVNRLIYPEAFEPEAGANN